MIFLQFIDELNHAWNRVEQLVTNARLHQCDCFVFSLDSRYFGDHGDVSTDKHFALLVVENKILQIELHNSSVWNKLGHLVLYNFIVGIDQIV